MRFLLVILWVSCLLPAQALWDKPYSTVTVSDGTTQIELHDFLPNVEQTAYKITGVPSGIDVQVVNNYTLILHGAMEKPMDFLELTVQNTQVVIPLKRSNKVQHTFTFQPTDTYEKLEIKGTFNNWDVSADPLTTKNGQYTLTKTLSPGRYEYVLVGDGKEFTDNLNENRISNGMGGYNSVLEVGDLSAAPFFTAVGFDKGKKEIRFWTASSNASIYPVLDNHPIAAEYVSSESNAANGTYFTLRIPDYAKITAKSQLRVYTSDSKKAGNDLWIPFSYGQPVARTALLNRNDHHTNIMYSVLVDRFRNGNPSNDRPLNIPEVLPAADWHGGDLAGITMQIRNNYFKNLNINSLWVSPIILNPEGPYGHMQEYGVDTKFSGYHGYWPISSSKIDPRFGSDEEFQQLIGQAHHQDMNVLLDYVANHVHEEHPLLEKHPDWKTDLILPDGRKNIRLYDEQRLTTWFDEFMPTLDLEREDVAKVMIDSAVFWFKKFRIDGFRHDATKHIPNSFWRQLTYQLKREITMPQNRALYQIGETYGSHELIASYVNTGMLDGQFEFNLFDKARSALMQPGYSMKNLGEALSESLTYYGSHHLMGTITGNHDKGRTISYADGSLRFDEDAKEAGYTRTINNVPGKGFNKMAQLFAFNMTVPGIPVIYYGDEIGMPGGDDPDSRRMMQFSGLNKDQSDLLHTVRKLTGLRSSRMELLYGQTEILHSDDHTLVYARNYLDKASLVVLSSAEKMQEIEVKLPKYLQNKEFMSEFGHSAMLIDGKLSIEIPAHGFEVLTSY